MKRVIAVILAAALALSLCACAKQGPQADAEPSGAPTWQEEYDLGVRYLSEGDYEQAIIAFTAAIEIDPKRAEAYLGLSDAYTGAGDPDAARRALEDGLAATDDPELQARLAALAEPGGEPEPDGEPEASGTPETSGAPTAVEYGQLELSGVSFEYMEGGWAVEDNEGAIGTLFIEFTVEGPAGLAGTRIATWFDEMPDEGKLRTELQNIEQIWKEADDSPGEHTLMTLPAGSAQSRPVDPDELGRTQYMVIAGLDTDFNIIAYAIFPVQIPAQ